MSYSLNSLKGFTERITQGLGIRVNSFKGAYIGDYAGFRI